MASGKILSWLKGLNLGQKLILSYISIVAVPVFFLGFNSIWSLELSTEQEALRNSRQSLKIAVERIQRSIDECQRAMYNLMSSNSFIEFISTKGDSGTEELLTFKRGPLSSVQAIQNNNIGLYSLRVFVYDPIFLEIWPTIYNASRISNLKWEEWGSGLRTKGHWRLIHREEPITDEKTELQEVVSLYREVRYPGKGTVGIAEVNMLSNNFFPSLYTREEHSWMCVIDKRNEIYFDSEGSFLSGGSIPLEGISDILTENSSSKEGYFRYTADYSEFLVVYTYMDTLDAYLYHITSTAQIKEGLNNARRLIMLFTLIAMIVFSIVTYLITSVILKKLKMIIITMRRVQSGELNVEIPFSGKDEIGELAYHFRKMLLKVNELISIIVKKQVAAKNAEIKALQTQINSHFIYNVLENIKMMAEIDSKYEISDAVDSLGSMMRYSMNWKKHYVSIQEELGYIRDYIALMNIRYDNHISLVIDVPQELLKREILKMTLQPIVENAVNHGISPKGNDGIIVIGITAASPFMYINIEDNGIGIDKARAEELTSSWNNDSSGCASEDNHGIGLKNVNDRIKLFFGTEYGLELESEKFEGTKVRIRLPY
ncbi:two-component system sensor histidine kinase YesM [Anaerobacterium chartisolvens]|uniref:histidine kinase n=1 Tax=Anaerobacterium chartisolvens TaxID=1297424 RepID=A0A369AM40_9FIRM|nr:sensor histidine kinase [Anaerobacterium chartisolvens]RCX08494.1 two-component system sensor histidine kinase YesM [Anaerobacterium chartisolvens]